MMRAHITERYALFDCNDAIQLLEDFPNDKLAGGRL